MTKQAINTPLAPMPLGAYSQAIKADNTIWLSGQIPKNPASGEMITGDFKAEAAQVFENLEAVAKAAGGDLNAIVKLTVFLMDLQNFAIVNQLMEERFAKPFPARSTIQVAALPAGARIEIEGVMLLERGE